MKKVMLVAAFGAIVSLQSSGDYMKWMVDPSSISNATSVDSHITGGNATVALANMKNYQYAALVASDSNVHNPWHTALYSSSTAKENYVGTSGDTSGYKVLQSSVFADGATIAAADIGIGTDYTGKFFFIELFDADGQLVGYSDAISGSQLAEYKETSRFAADWANTSAWGGGKFTAVPEPTGGLMILLGAGLIGLRRKKFI